MRILCAPDKFKGTVSATEAAEAMARGVREAGHEVDAIEMPVADGGEGTLEALLRLGGTKWNAEVLGPGGDPIDAEFGLTRDCVGVVELASASGLSLLPPERRDPTRTTSFGTGQLIAAAHRAGGTRIIIGVGGSATCDGGAGLAQALGVRFFDRRGDLIVEPMAGGKLPEIARIEPASRPPEIEVACDVLNPLCGPDGAAAVYGPQKGASPDQVHLLDDGLHHLAQLVGANPDTPGFGAAGGAAFGLAAFCGATISRGIDVVLRSINFHEVCHDADLVITGEGRLDAQSLQGKACFGVAQAAKQMGVETIAIVGSFGPGVERWSGVRG